VDLVEYLAHILNCAYESDLHYLRLTPEQAALIARIDETRFTPRQFEQAAQYMLNCEESFPDAAQAKRAMIERASRR
jgi:hypothetical protein